MGWVSGSRGPLILPSCFVLNVVLDILFAGAPFFLEQLSLIFLLRKTYSGLKLKSPLHSPDL